MLLISDMDIEITSRPFSKSRLKKIKQDLRLGKIRRFAAIIDHRKLGFSHNALVVWEKSSLSQKLSGQLKNKDYISHIYLRKANHLWPYGLYTMLHAQSKDGLKAFIAQLSELMDGCAYKVLNTIKEFKKTSFNPKCGSEK